MTFWTPDLLNRPSPPYLAICDALAEGMDCGALAPGQRLPSQRMLARQLGVALGTVTKAYGEARRRGWIQGEPGRGTFLRYHLPPNKAQPFEEPPPPLTLDLRQNFPVAVPAEAAAWKSAGRFLSRRPSDWLQPRSVWSQLSSTQQALGAEWIGRLGWHPNPEQIIHCKSERTARTSILAAICRPGDAVMSAALGHPSLAATARHRGIRLCRVATDSRGILPESLDQQCRKTSAKVLLVQPTLPTPTNATMPMTRRKKIVEIAKTHDVDILEEEESGFLWKTPLPPIAALAPERTFLIASTRLALSPELSLCFVHAPSSKHSDVLTELTTLAELSTSPWSDIFARWMETRADQAILRERRRALRHRQRIAREQLGPSVRGDERSHHVWLPLPRSWRSERFTQVARERGVSVTPARWFALTRGSTPECVRLGLGNPPQVSQLRWGLEVLRDLLRNPTRR